MLKKGGVALALLLAYVGLGLAVSQHPPRGIDLAAAQLVGTATPVAAFLTFLGRFTPYAIECVAVLVAGLVRRAWLGRAVAAVSLLIVAEVTSDEFKLVFHRARPEHWLVTHETSFSYSSGHATSSLVFFGFWAYVALRSALPRGARVASALALLAVSGAIGWSRIALGAHYPTDVFGGYLLGGIVLVVGLAVIPQSVYGYASRATAASISGARVTTDDRSP